MYDEIDWVPYIFIPDKKGKTKTIFGDNVKKLEFSNYKKYKIFNDDKELIKFENNVKPEIQFLCERYSYINDNDIELPDLRICYFDIETISYEKGFTPAREANGFVSSIAILINDQLTIFGIKPYVGKFKENFIYCKNEEQLLIKFFKFLHRMDIDVITGWNSDKYDLTFLYTRCNKLFGENNKIFKKISPINKVRVWESRDGKELKFNISGVSVLDYLKVYKNYSKRNVENYKLNTIGKIELNETKLEYNGKLKDLYENDWEKYIDYNAQDIYLIKNLEESLGYIHLIQRIASTVKTPMEYYNSAVNLAEGMFLTYYRRNNLCAPTMKGGKESSFEAGFVKEPQRGLHDWVIDLDVTSMYPHNIIVGNMSPETYIGTICSMTENEILTCIKNRKWPEFELETDEGIKIFNKGKLKNFNLLFEKKFISIAPNGSIFKTTEEGILPKIEKKFFLMRKKMKQEMLKAKKENRPSSEIVRLHCAQYAFKILINGNYGVIATPYSRLFNWRIAEAIPAMGRYLIKTSDKMVNELFNEFSPSEVMKKDFSW